MRIRFCLLLLLALTAVSGPVRGGDDTNGVPEEWRAKVESALGSRPLPGKLPKKARKPDAGGGMFVLTYPR